MDTPEGTQIGAEGCTGPFAGISVGSGCGVLFFPRVLVQLFGLEGRATHHIGRGSLVQVALNTLPQGIDLFP
jgi:hypothetical protein